MKEMISWPEFTLPPINLWSAPYQKTDERQDTENDGYFIEVSVPIAVRSVGYDYLQIR
jgi:hypothetical protein